MAKRVQVIDLETDETKTMFTCDVREAAKHCPGRYHVITDADRAAAARPAEKISVEALAADGPFDAEKLNAAGRPSLVDPNEARGSRGGDLDEASDGSGPLGTGAHVSGNEANAHPAVAGPNKGSLPGGGLAPAGVGILPERDLPQAGPDGIILEVTDEGGAGSDASSG